MESIALGERGGNLARNSGASARPLEARIRPMSSRCTCSDECEGMACLAARMVGLPLWSFTLTSTAEGWPTHNGRVIVK